MQVFKSMAPLGTRGRVHYHHRCHSREAIFSAGASSETLHKIKFGRGVVGKIAVVAVFALGAIAVASVHVSPNGALIAIGAVVLLSFFVLSAILLVVMKQPELALLEGAELVMYKHMALGVKGGPPLAGDSGQPVAPTPPQDSLPAQDESQNGR